MQVSCLSILLVHLFVIIEKRNCFVERCDILVVSETLSCTAESPFALLNFVLFFFQILPENHQSSILLVIMSVKHLATFSQLLI